VFGVFCLQIRATYTMQVSSLFISSLSLLPSSLSLYKHVCLARRTIVLHGSYRKARFEILINFIGCSWHFIAADDVAEQSAAYECYLSCVHNGTGAAPRAIARGAVRCLALIE